MYSCCSIITPNGGSGSFSFFLTIDFFHFLSVSLEKPPVQSSVAPLSGDLGTGCDLCCGSKAPVDGLKSTSEEVLLLDLRCELTPEKAGDCGKPAGNWCPRGGDSKFEDTGDPSELTDTALSGVNTIVSRLSRASRRAFNLRARCTS